MTAGASKRAIIISISSDIGEAMAWRWKQAGWEISGTYRTSSKAVEKMAAAGMHLVHCELADATSVINACEKVAAACYDWDMLVLCPGNQEPVGAFDKVSFDEWDTSIQVNFTNQMRIVHELLPLRRNSDLGPCVLFFAGGGTNNAPQNYSGYIISKIALVKMTEILDAEIPDTRFVILGPGWVKTKIHDATLKAPQMAGSNYQRTVEKLASSDCTPMEDVLECCDWIAQAPREVIGGRNFSVVFDAWGDSRLDQKLRCDHDMYKLRRQGNDFLKRGAK
ncbi:MAG: SDR family oxidoreductase [Oligoflexia bacterium]|nr:SDR family oxidoreductase [Oligoflexia bacterium]